jgi:PAS domain S-box-containing protein
MRGAGIVPALRKNRILGHLVCRRAQGRPARAPAGIPRAADLLKEGGVVLRKLSDSQPNTMPDRPGWLTVMAGFIIGLVGGWLVTVAHGSSQGADDYELELVDTSGPLIPTTQDVPPNALDVGQAWLRIVDQMPAIMFTTDADLTVTFISGGGMQMIGITPDMYVGKNIADQFVDPGTAIPAHMAALKGRSVVYEYGFRGRQYDIRVEPLRTGDDRIIGTVAIAVDITQRIVMEKTLRDMQMGLEQRVRERTAELSRVNERLQSEIAQHQQTAKQLYQSKALYQGIVNSQTDFIMRLDLSGRFTFANEACCRMLGKTWEELEGTLFHTFIYEEDKPTVLEAVERLQRPPYKDEHPLRFRMHTVKGVRWIVWEGQVSRPEPGVAAEFQSVGRDIHEQVQIEEAERRQRALAEALGDSAATIVSTLDLSEVLSRILANLGEVVEHDAANIMLIDADGLAANAGYQGYPPGLLRETVAAANFRIEDIPLLRRMMKDRKPVLVEDTKESDEWVEAISPDSPIRSYLGAPIVIEDEVLGFLNLDCWQPNGFDETDFDRLRAFTDHVAIAIHNARLHEKRQEAAAYRAAEGERQRIARELHDAVSQTLFTAHTIAESLPRIWAQNPDRAEQDLAEISRLTRGALAEMRSLLYELRTEDLVGVTLDDLLEQLVHAFIGKSHTALTLAVHGRTPLTPEVRVVLYRITQEALNNIRKHARAGKAEIVLESDGDRVTLRIQDDGRGFDPSATRSGRMGLKIMRERAASIGALLRVDSEPDKGTTVEVVWPTPEHGGQDDE